METIMNSYLKNTSSRKLFLRPGPAGLALLLFSSQPFAASVNLAWDASPSPNVGGYIVSYGPSSGKYSSNIDAGSKTALTISGAKEGATYYAAVKAYDSARKTESSYSNEVSKTIPATAKTTVATNGATTGAANGATSGAANESTSGGTAGATSGGTAGATNGATTSQTTSNNGLVAAYGFEETSGNTVADASGKGNHGTIREATRIAKGRYGQALQFDGVNDWVTIKDSPSLDLSTSMTLEAWVNPQSQAGEKALIAKEQSGGAVYGLLNADANVPAAGIYDGQYHVLPGQNQLPVNEWTHLVVTYDGQYGRLYMNGVEVAKGAEKSLIQASNGELRIGGNSTWGAYFKGLIDEVRIYNRALTAAEVQYNLKTAISVSNPPKFVMGDKNEEPWVEYVPQGIAQAYQTVSKKSGVLTQVKVYLDASTTATQLVAGIYKDNKGHPGALVAQGKLNTVKPDAWNAVSIAGASVTANKPYWIAIMGPNGEVGFLDRVGSGKGLMEKSSGRNALKDLPNTWTGSRRGYKTNASMSLYGLGH
jgi:hypothetical protein